MAPFKASSGIVATSNRVFQRPVSNLRRTRAASPLVWPHRPQCLSPIQARAYVTCIYQHRQMRRQRPDANKSVHGLRQKSSWSPNSYPFAPFWLRRLRGNFHRPGCTWVTSSESPSTTPRDKDCPACQVEESRHLEMSEKELIWERQWERMRAMVHRDPWDFIFGDSHRRLRGENVRDFWDRQVGSLPSWNDRIRENIFEDGQHLRRQMEEMKKEALNEFHSMPSSKPDARADEQPKTPVSAAKEPTKTPEEKSHTALPKSNATNDQHIRGYGSWSVSGISNGQSFHASGELEFDPITMRMVPKTADKAPSSATQQSLPMKVGSNNHAVAIPVIKSTAVTTKSDESQNIQIQPSPPNGTTITTTEVSHESSSNTVSSGPLVDTDSISSSVQASSSEKPVVQNRIPDTEVIETKQILERSWVRDNQKHRDEEQVKKAIADSKEAVNFLQSAVKNLSSDTSFAEDVKYHPETMTAVLQVKRAITTMKLAAKAVQENSSQLSHVHSAIVATKDALDAVQHLIQNNLDQPELLQSMVSNPQEQPDAKHFNALGRSVSESGDPSIKAFKSLASREKPLKLMSIQELNKHRKTLLESWASRRSKHQDSETAADRQLKNEIEQQKAAMAAYERLAHARVYAPQNQTIKETVGENFAALSTKMQQQQDEALEDQRLINEIKDIYEDTYGPINRPMRRGQLVEGSQAPISSATSSASADLLSMKSVTPDASDNKPIPIQIPVKEAARKWTSLQARKPGRYEVVAADDTRLIIQRISDDSPSSVAIPATGDGPGTGEAELPKSTKVNPIDGTTFNRLPPLPQTGNFASPTGFVNHDIPTAIPCGEQASAKEMQKPPPSSIPSAENPRIRKQEAVFSGGTTHRSHVSGFCRHRGGGRHGRHYKRGGWRRVLRKISTLFLAVVFAAATAYSLGAYMENSKARRDWLRELRTDRTYWEEESERLADYERQLEMLTEQEILRREMEINADRRAMLLSSSIAAISALLLWVATRT